jgi:hypothetical protein
MAVKGATNICDLSLIYNRSFCYCLPQSDLESLLSGDGAYTKKERRELLEDINEIYSRMVGEKSTRGEIAVLTAGVESPVKARALEFEMEKDFKGVLRYVCLNQEDITDTMTRTYVQELTKEGASKKEAIAMKWRLGAEGAMHVIFANLIRDGFCFYFGHTSTSATTPMLFRFLKEKGRYVKVIHITEKYSLRPESLVLRMDDTFLKYADELEFRWFDGVEKNGKHVATWIKNPLGSDQLGTLRITDIFDYNEIKKAHNAAAESLRNTAFLWERLFERRSDTTVEFIRGMEFMSREELPWNAQVVRKE